MASVRFQAFAAIEAKLELVLKALDWKTLVRDPRDPIGEDQMNALVLGTGGDDEPDSLTGHVSTHRADFAVGMIVIERDGGPPAEELLDTAFVAVSNALLDPNDIQLGGLVVDVRRGGMTPAMVGASPGGARMIGVQSIDFSFDYWARESDAETPGP
jgi:hypothetical protein